MIERYTEKYDFHHFGRAYINGIRSNSGSDEFHVNVLIKYAL